MKTLKTCYQLYKANDYCNSVGLYVRLAKTAGGVAIVVATVTA